MLKTVAAKEITIKVKAGDKWLPGHLTVEAKYELLDEDGDLRGEGTNSVWDKITRDAVATLHQSVSRHLELLLFGTQKEVMEASTLVRLEKDEED